MITMTALTTIFTTGIVGILIPGVVYSTPCFELPSLCNPPSGCSGSSSDRPWYEKLNFNFDLDLDIDIEVYKEAFTECPYVDNECERDVYMVWMKKYSKEQLKYVDIIMKKLTVQKALTEEIKNYESFKQSISSAYEVFKSKNIYSKEVDLSSQIVVFEETKTQIVEAMSCVSEESELYTSLNYCKEHDVNMMPIIVGLCKSVATSQETYVSEYSKCTETTSTISKAY